MTKKYNGKVLNYHHTSLCTGYVKVGKEIIEEYVGKFGKGIKVKTNNPNSSRYCNVSYYLEA